MDTSWESYFTAFGDAMGQQLNAMRNILAGMTTAYSRHVVHPLGALFWGEYLQSVPEASVETFIDMVNTCREQNNVYMLTEQERDTLVDELGVLHTVSLRAWDKWCQQATAQRKEQHDLRKKFSSLAGDATAAATARKAEHESELADLQRSSINASTSGDVAMVASLQARIVKLRAEVIQAADPENDAVMNEVVGHAAEQHILDQLMATLVVEVKAARGRGDSQRYKHLAKGMAPLKAKRERLTVIGAEIVKLQSAAERRDDLQQQVAALQDELMTAVKQKLFDHVTTLSQQVTGLESAMAVADSDAKQAHLAISQAVQNKERTLLAAEKQLAALNATIDQAVNEGSLDTLDELDEQARVLMAKVADLKPSEDTGDCVARLLGWDPHDTDTVLDGLEKADAAGVPLTPTPQATFGGAVTPRGRTASGALRSTEELSSQQLTFAPQVDNMPVAEKRQIEAKVRLFAKELDGVHGSRYTIDRVLRELGIKRSRGGYSSRVHIFHEPQLHNAASVHRGQRRVHVPHWSTPRDDTLCQPRCSEPAASDLLCARRTRPRSVRRQASWPSRSCCPRAGRTACPSSKTRSSA